MKYELLNYFGLGGIQESFRVSMVTKALMDAPGLGGASLPGDNGATPIPPLLPGHPAP
jgi:hypothetical protein